MNKYIERPQRNIKAATQITDFEDWQKSKIKGNQILSFMKLESISVAGKDASQSGVGKKFLKISISFTVLLNISICIWFFMNDMGRFLVKWNSY